MSDTSIKWALSSLEKAGYQIQDSVEPIQNTPWSTVCRFKTDKGFVYLKKVPPALFIETTVIQLLKSIAPSFVPSVIAINKNEHCFLMEDAGIRLHEHFNKTFNAQTLKQILQEYSSLQILSMQTVEDFISVGVPNWGTANLPALYLALTERENLLLADGLLKDEIRQLKLLSAQLKEICDQLLGFKITDSFSHADFHPKNILINTQTHKATIIDLGEVVISHPFFSLNNCLHMTRENFSPSETQYNRLVDACLEPWLSIESRDNLHTILSLVAKCWMIPAVLGEVRLMDSVNKDDVKKLQREGRLSRKFRAWLEAAL